MDPKNGTRNTSSSTSTSTSPSTNSGATLRRPVQVVKKRSGPLEDALAELSLASGDGNGGRSAVGSAAASTPADSASRQSSSTAAPIVAGHGRAAGSPPAVSVSVTAAPPTTTTTTSPPLPRRRPTIKEKDKKRERWLLTRKTWKYMTDAGRKLIPDGVQNRREDVPKIEAHFQQVCAAEPRFILWRRKASFPGATRNSKRRLKHLLQHTGQKHPQTMEALEQEEAYNQDHLIDLLTSHLKLDESCKTTTLLGSKTVRPDQTASPSAQRPGSGIGGKGGVTSPSLRGPGFLATQQQPREQLSEIDQLLERLRTLSRTATCRSMLLPPECITRDTLEDKVLLKQIYNSLKKQQLHRILSRHSTAPPPTIKTNLKHSSSLSSLLHFGGIGGIGGIGGGGGSVGGSKHHSHGLGLASTQIKEVGPEWTGMEFSPFKGSGSGGGSGTGTGFGLGSGISTKGSSSSGGGGGGTMASTGALPKKSSLRSTNMPSMPRAGGGVERQRKPPSTLDLPGFGSGQGVRQRAAAPAKRKPHVEKQYNSCGTQTSFIQLHEIKRLAEEYRELKREEAALASSSGTPAATDDEAEKSAGPHHHRRKSSIDNEDVSQSVSDTIKRYLRMARKKSVHDENANRFKRVNYDRNLRNIRAKGEINPPGMDEGNCKAVQTLDAWPQIQLDFIRGNENSGILDTAHAEWRKALDERIQKKLEYEQKIAGNADGTTGAGAGAGVTSTSPAAGAFRSPTSSAAGPLHKQSVSSCSSSSAPTSPTSDQYAQMTPLTSPSGGSGGSGTGGAGAGAGGGGGGGGGLLHTGSQFLSNLWHGATNTTATSSAAAAAAAAASPTAPSANSHYHHQQRQRQDQPHQQRQQSDGHSNSGSGSGSGGSSSLIFNKNKSLAGGTSNSAAMQKSKSSSNVGQFMSRKILKSRSKSQTRPTTQAPLSKWAPSDKCAWTSENGDRILLLDGSLQNLSDVEAKILQRVAIEKISELNIGVNISVDHDGKSQKRRVLPKKKAMTTSFINIGKKDDHSSSSTIFGNSLECCVANDKKRVSSLSASRDRGSRTSIASLFRSGGSGDSSKLSENVRSCESLPSSTFSLTSQPAEAARGGKGNSKGHSSYFGNLSKSSSMQISRSQSDVRRKSQEFDSTFELNSGGADGKDLNDGVSELQVPTFVSSCIKYLEDNGLSNVGLFRISTSVKRVKQLREDFDKNSDTHIEAGTSPHEVAALLKEFLRDLPEPLLCNNLYKAFLETQRVRNRRLQLEAISHLVKLLPAAHRDTLFVLLRFLARVAASSDDVTNLDGTIQISGNKMGSHNLATIFAPNILRSNLHSNESASRSGAIEQESLTDAINVIRIMIDHYEELYRVPAELLDTVYSHMLDACPDKLFMIFQQRTALLKDEMGKSSCSSVSSPEQITSPTAPAPMATPSKRLYTRKSVMHENDASRAPDAVTNGSSGSKRYSDVHSTRGSHSIAQKLRHDERRNFEASDRRQSSPNVLDKSGVVSASLQIPVPVQTHFKTSSAVGGAGAGAMAMAMSEQNDLDEVFYKAGSSNDNFEYADIPYIEDASSSLEMEILNECFPISGSLSFSTKMDVPGREMQQQQQQQYPPQPIKMDSVALMRRESASTPNVDTLSATATTAKLGHEPKLPTSISNIGGAILRSKTADFERMSVKMQQQQQQQHQQQQHQQLRSSLGGTSSAGQTPTQTLYKRQELIPSAKRSGNSK